MGVIGREAVPVKERACAKTGVIKRDRRFSFRFSLVPRLSLAPYRLQDKAGSASHHLEKLSSALLLSAQSFPLLSPVTCTGSYNDSCFPISSFIHLVPCVLNAPPIHIKILSILRPAPKCLPRQLFLDPQLQVITPFPRFLAQYVWFYNCGIHCLLLLFALFEH